MAKFTLLELHLDESPLTANAPYSFGEKEIGAGDEPSEEDGESKKGAVFAALIGLVFLAVVAYVVKRKVLDTEDEAPPEFDEIDD